MITIAHPRGAFRGAKLLLMTSFVIVCLLACADSTVEPPVLQDLALAVTGEAAENLKRGSGTFTLPVIETEGTPLITPDRALELAMALLAGVGDQLLPAWEKRHGHPIDLEQLVPDSRVQVVSSQNDRKARASTLYVGVRGDLYIAAPDQPSVETVQYISDYTWPLVTRSTKALHRRAGQPIAFEHIRIDN